MPDRYDPKVSPRPSTDRRSGSLSPETEDDPLVELAKIVQGRPIGANASARGRSAASDQAGKAPSGGDPFSDLEAELLNDLQASFAAVKEAAAAPTPLVRPPVREPDPPQAEPEEDAFAAPPVIERPAPPQAAAPRPEPPRPDAAPLEFRMEPLEDGPPRFVPIPPPPVMQPPVQQRSAPMAEPPPADRTARAAARPPLAGDPRQEKRADVGGNFQLRPTAPVAQNPAPPPQQSKQAHSRWEKPEPQKPQATSASRFAPPKAAPAPQPQQSFDDLDDDLDPFADGGVFADAGKTEGDGQFPLEGFGLAPGYGEEDETLPPFQDDDDLAAAPRPRGRRNLMIVGAVAAIAIAGGLAFAVLTNGTSSTGTPPTIVADGGPTKITPDDSATDADPQSKLIYDRIASGENTSTDSTLLTPGDGAIAEVPSDGQTADPLARVIIPGGPGVDAPQTDDALGLAEQPGSVEPPVAEQPADVAANDTGDVIEAIGPRKVRTVIVKPDGTIVSSAATDAPAAEQPAADTPVAVVPPTPVPPPLPAPVTDDTAAIAGNTTAELPITAVPDASTGNSTLAAEPPAADVATAPAPEPQPPAVETPPVTRTPPPADDQPIDLASAPPPAAQATGGGMLVQISSQRSEDAARATYRDLQARYPRILGNFDADIQRAEIPDRGVFYRVRVGPFSAGDAQRLCDDLKSAGGDCILAQR